MAQSFHTPVLLHKSVELTLNNELDNRIIIDCTLGGGGYSEEILKQLKPGDRLIAIDKDTEAIDYASERLKKYKDQLTIVNSSFGKLSEIADKLEIKGIAGIVMDLGLSSYQLENEEGFSFMRDTPLDMRADKSSPLTAEEVLNEYSETGLSKIFEEFGEIGNPNRLAASIADARKKGRLSSTKQLVDVVDRSYKINKKDQIDFLAKIFQSLRIEVNNELEDLKNVLNASLHLLVQGGRIAAVSYHSLEDRIVKNFLKENSKAPKISKYSKEEKVTPPFTLLTKKAILPEQDEIKVNSRARSAKLRAAEKL